MTLLTNNVSQNLNLTNGIDARVLKIDIVHLR